ncbi:MAG: PRD domain-containing protein, partial [Staphylococcus equorum]|nr:PRD domain-containing protein [Staphylococcus equorum]
VNKVLNVNVIVIEKDGRDAVAFGKGVGYHQKIGAQVPGEKISKIYVPIENNRIEFLVEFINKVPIKYLEIANEVVNQAEETLSTELSASTLYALTDHIYFTVERIKEDVMITSSMYWEFKRFYPKEFEAAKKGVNIIENALNVTLSEQEIGNITFHIINGNSESNLNMYATQITKVVTNVLKSIQLLLNSEIDEQSLHYERLVTHIKFFAERYLTDTMLQDDSTLIETVSLLYKKSMHYSRRIQRTLEEIYHKTITQEEIAYLAIHINRLLISQSEE